MTAANRPMPAQAEIAARRKNTPLNLPRNNAVCKPIKAEFADSDRWDELAGKHLPAFNLPKWEEGCTPKQMVIWLERLNFTEQGYQKFTNTTLEEFIHKNPAWPLRAFVGTILEARAE